MDLVIDAVISCQKYRLDGPKNTRQKQLNLITEKHELPRTSPAPVTKVSWDVYIDETKRSYPPQPQSSHSTDTWKFPMV